jgi:hypothetical protein
MASKVRPEARIFSRNDSGSMVPSSSSAPPQGTDQSPRSFRRHAPAGFAGPLVARAAAIEPRRHSTGIVGEHHHAVGQLAEAIEVAADVAIRTPLPGRLGLAASCRASPR